MIAPSGEQLMFFDTMPEEITAASFQLPVAPDDPRPWNYDSQLYGTDTDDPIAGTSDDDWIFGGGGRDNINGRAGADIIDAGSGNDWFVRGGGGADIFRFKRGDDDLKIFDFQHGIDTIWLGDDLVFSDFTASTKTRNGITTLTLQTDDGDRLMLRDVDPLAIDAGDFF